MVPLTPVAFQPGELVHTNEFFVTASGAALAPGEEATEANGTWMSAHEVADMLRQRLQATQLSTPQHVDTPSPPHQPPKPTPSPPQQSSSSSSSTGIFEIREFVDDAGNVTGHEVVDLAKQMKDMQQRVATAMAAEDAAPSSSSSPSSSSMRGLATYLGRVAEDMDDGAVDDDDDDYEDLSGGGDDGDGDGHANVRATAVDTAAALAKLGELELEEAEFEAAERVREQERLLQERQRAMREEAALPQAGPGGWKTGFLSGGGGKKAAAAAGTSATAKKQVHFDGAAPVPVPSAPSSAPAPVPPRPAAFTGTVMERFP